MLNGLQRFLGALFLFTLSVVGLIWVAGVFVSNVESGRTTIADRLGVEPEWEAIRKHTYCTILRPGTPKETVESQLLQIGKYEFEHNSFAQQSEIRFENIILQLAIGQLQIRYDWRERLHSREIENYRGETIEIGC